MTRGIIMGAAGRDFHNFNVLFREDNETEIVAFTATQIPGIDDKSYPPSLAGPRYPEGIPIRPEEELEELIRKHQVDFVMLSYSDLSHETVMEKASRVAAAGARFVLASAQETMVPSVKPVVSICAVRTGCGKSQTTRKVCDILMAAGKKVAVVRHPMPYGDLEKQAVQRFASYEDLEKHDCTIEEREEYEPHIDRGIVVFAGVDYERILREAEKEADIVVWDGGNNDTPLFKPDLQIVVADPHRPGHELTYYPGRINLRIADVILLNKVNTAKAEDIEIVERNCVAENPAATILKGDSIVTVDDADAIKGKRVLVVEDGPTLTHGEMEYGAGVVAAEQYGAAEIVSPVADALGSIKTTFENYPHVKRVLPAMGYSDKQRHELQETINKVDCDLVLAATPIDLGKLLEIKHPLQRVQYELECPELEDALKPVLEGKLEVAR